MLRLANHNMLHVHLVGAKCCFIFGVALTHLWGENSYKIAIISVLYLVLHQIEDIESLASLKLIMPINTSHLQCF